MAIAQQPHQWAAPIIETAEVEVRPRIPNTPRVKPWPRIPVLIRDASPSGLLVLISREEGWLYKPQLEINTALTRTTPVYFWFKADGFRLRVPGTISWSEGGQAGLRLHLASVDGETRKLFEEWVTRLADALKEEKD